MSNNNEFHVRGFNILPLVTKNLLIINGLFFLATYALGRMNIDLIDILGLHFISAQKFHLYQFVTYMFMHGSFSHIFFNMFALWMFGSALENFWGAKRFLFYYFVTGVGAAVIHYLVVYIQISPDLQLLNTCIQDPTFANVSNLVSNHRFHLDAYSGEIWTQFQAFQQDFQWLGAGVNIADAQESISSFLIEYREHYLNLPNVVGASGAVFGLLLAFGMTFPNAVIYIYFLFPMKAKWFVIFYGVLELFSGVMGSNNGIAHFAHLGGMIFGIFLILYWRYKNKQRINRIRQQYFVSDLLKI